MKNFFLHQQSERTIGKLIRNFFIIFLGFVLLMTISTVVQIPMEIRSIIFALGGLIVFGFWVWTIIQVIKRLLLKTHKEENSADQKFQLNLTRVSFGIGVLIIVSIVVNIVSMMMTSAS